MPDNAIGDAAEDHASGGAPAVGHHDDHVGITAGGHDLLGDVTDPHVDLDVPLRRAQSIGELLHRFVERRLLAGLILVQDPVGHDDFMVDRDVQEDQLLAGDVRGIGQRSLGCVRAIDRNDDPVERCGCSGWGFGSHDDLLPLPGPSASLPWSCLFDPGESRARGMHLLCILYAIPDVYGFSCPIRLKFYAIVSIPK